MKIYLYTSYYPFTLMSESFLTPELEIGVKKGIDITVIPVNKDKEERELPQGVKIDYQLCNLGLLSKVICFFHIFMYLKYSEISDFTHLLSLKDILDTVKYLYAANLVYRDVKRRAKDQTNLIFYSYWLSYAPIAFSLYKVKHQPTSHLFVARGHGSDVYGKQAGVYYPMRNFVFINLDKLFIISEYGKKFLENKNPSLSHKLYLSRLGVYDNRREKSIENIIRFVSCSSIIPLKRVNLIASSIINFAKSHNEYNIEWVHIGNGPQYSLIEQQVSNNTLSNLSCFLRGTLNNKEILRYYREVDITAFILLSTTEGIPVSIMEALSSAIPIIATDVGGVSEIVNKETGVLLEKDFSQDEFDKACINIIENRDNFSESAYNFFRRNYEAFSNYEKFYEAICK